MIIVFIGYRYICILSWYLKSWSDNSTVFYLQVRKVHIRLNKNWFSGKIKQGHGNTKSSCQEIMF